MTEALKRIILDTGFYETGIVDISGLHYYPEIREICEKNTCRSYNTTWACPPAVGTLEECKARVGQYDSMLLFTGKFELANSFDFKGMMRSMSLFKEMTDRLDSEVKSVLSGYQILSNEGCGKCKRCTWPDSPCRFPDQLHHSIEGYGFLVNELAKAAGIKYNNGQNTVTYFGALLYKNKNTGIQ